ncbi:MAG: ankyrin repeat domain-containing protein [Pirellulaceae bacterium]
MKSDELFLRYLMGTASEAEVNELERRLREDESLQDEYMRHVELDALLHQEAQSATPGDEAPKADFSSSRTSPNLWKWVSGISTLAASILLVAFALNFPSPSPVMAYPSLGKTSFEVPMAGADIWAAAGRGDLETLRRELQSGTSVDTRTPESLTALHIAAVADQPQIASVLLGEGADVSLTERKGNTALHMAAFHGNTEVVRALLAHRADPNVRNELGFNSMDLVAVVWSPGLESFYRGLEAELEIKIDLLKVQTERPRILKLLVAADDSDAGVAPGTSVIQAAIEGNTSAMEQHIVAGTDLNQTEDFGGSTPLMLAAVFGMRDIARILIDAGVNLEARNKTGGTALHTACFFCRPEIVMLLLSAGADPNQINNRGLTPLEIVTIEFDAESQGAYRHVYESLGLTFDVENVQQTRSGIANLLQSHIDEENRVPNEHSTTGADRNRANQ